MFFPQTCTDTFRADVGFVVGRFSCDYLGKYDSESENVALWTSLVSNP